MHGHRIVRDVFRFCDWLFTGFTVSISYCEMLGFVFFFLEFSSVKNVSIVPMRCLSGQRMMHLLS